MQSRYIRYTGSSPAARKLATGGRANVHPFLSSTIICGGISGLFGLLPSMDLSPLLLKSTTTSTTKFFSFHCSGLLVPVCALGSW